ncbi:phosphoglycerate mutase [Ottowia sp. VDI28]|uniref:phosphoglycerate mutase n=1 Tax=Ottowia sp. VDI28 TaxID=3133968 RepID=UPI003C2E603A
MSSPEPLRHLIIPGALLPLPDDQPRPALPPLPHLDALLRRMKPVGAIVCDDETPSDPAELATARALGLPSEPGRIPWAALETGTIGTPCAWLMPCHWQLGMDHVLLTDPVHLQLGEDQSRALLSTAEPLLREDGIATRYLMPNAWLAQGEVFRALSTWSMTRATGRRLTPALLASTPVEKDAALLRRLQSELQMLFYTHPVNEARESAGQLPINALWIKGAGVLDEPHPPRADVLVESRLVLAEQAQTGATLEQATAAHHEAWKALDADTGARLLAALQAGQDVRLTLCGPRQALELAPAPQSWASRISSFSARRRRWANF